MLRWFEEHGFDGADTANRRAAAIEAMHPDGNRIAVTIEVRDTSPLLLGTGEGVTASGAGLPLHAPSGLPFIPASSLRGVARRRPNADQEELSRLFGRGDQPGAVQILDALPTGRVALREDVITPHHTSYHQHGGQPTGLDRPVPIPLLTISSAKFETWLLPAGACTASDLTRAAEALIAGLHEEGLGAKTTSGYGYVHARNK